MNNLSASGSVVNVDVLWWLFSTLRPSGFLPSPLCFSWVSNSGLVDLWDLGFTAEGLFFSSPALTFEVARCSTSPT
ncbi:unnamed protein product [Arabis nemorensis]|uniref:Uncharacterized protein n=1 Tax=Arabis nemorensis TaxID=586526 RepID=A0A565CGB9_9BRAS|nr:unnamed protein product [Arabis nemorensis]